MLQSLTVICYRYSWQLTLVILSVTPVILIVMFLQGTCMKVLTEQELSALAGAGPLPLFLTPSHTLSFHSPSIPPHPSLSPLVSRPPQSIAEQEAKACMRSVTWHGTSQHRLRGTRA